MVKIATGMRFNAYEIMSRAVEMGIDYGYMRAFKHTDTPNEDAIKSEIRDAVMNELADLITFDGDN
jgi:hypothetical protein